MRIGLDLHTVTHLMQGSRTYIWNLTQALLQENTEHEFVCYFANPGCFPQDERFTADNVTCAVMPQTGRIARLTTAWPHQLRRDHIDLFHCQYMGPLTGRIPYVVTIHDILYEQYPQFYPGRLSRLMKVGYPLSARRAAQVLTGSESTRMDLQQRYHVPHEKITVTPYAAAPEFTPVTSPDLKRKAMETYGISAPFVLTVGRIEPRKNLQRLAEAFARLRNRFPQHCLVIAGMRDPLFQEYYTSIQSTLPGQRIYLAGGIAQQDLPALYSAADLFVYPSYAEGFGLPVLEAMACGAAVLTSNTTSLPEVVGQAGRMVPPDDTEELSNAMATLLTDHALRARLQQAALKQAAGFSWQQTARATLAVYETHGRRDG